MITYNSFSNQVICGDKEKSYGEYTFSQVVKLPSMLLSPLEFDFICSHYRVNVAIESNFVDLKMLKEYVTNKKEKSHVDKQIFRTTLNTRTNQ